MGGNSDVKGKGKAPEEKPIKPQDEEMEDDDDEDDDMEEDDEDDEHVRPLLPINAVGIWGC